MTQIKQYILLNVSTIAYILGVGLSQPVKKTDKYSEWDTTSQTQLINTHTIEPNTFNFMSHTHILV